MKTSHHQTFIEEMKQQLLTEQKVLTEELSNLTEKNVDPNTQEFTAEFPQYGHNEEDNAMEVEEYEVRLGTKHEVEVRAKELQAALEQIEKGTYGVTTDGQLIPEERLRANPAATTLVPKPQ